MQKVQFWEVSGALVPSPPERAQLEKAHLFPSKRNWHLLMEKEEHEVAVWVSVRRRVKDKVDFISPYKI